MSKELNLLRSQIARIVGNDPRAIRAFEALFSQTQTIIPSNVHDVEISAANAEAMAVQAVGAIDRLASAVELLALIPVQPTVVLPDDLTPPYVMDLAGAAGTLPVGSIRWNVRVLTADATAAVGDFCDCDTTGGDVDVTLPDPTLPVNVGREIMCGKSYSGANDMTIIGTVSGVVNPTYAAQYSQVVLVSNGVEWISK